MIPKVIHYCWFGNALMPKKQSECIKKWKKILPDYEIRCWNESSIDINAIPFLKQAYEAKKWAFVADYTRIYALLKYGGIYMDTDVVVKRSFNPYLKYSFFTSYEYHPGYNHMPIIHQMIDENGNRRKGINKKEKVPGVGLMSAIIASEPGTQYLRELLEWYDSMSFKENREKNYTIPTTLAIIAEKYGFRYVNTFQLLEGNMAIFPSNIFADYRTANSKSVAIHLCFGSWGESDGILSNLHHFLYEVFYRIKWIRNLYLNVRNIFSEYKVHY